MQHAIHAAPHGNAKSTRHREDLVARIKLMMAKCENTTRPKPHLAQRILDDVAEALFSMYVKGYSHYQMTQILALCDVESSEEELRGFFARHWMNQLATFEHRLANTHKNDAAMSFAETAAIEARLRTTLREGSGFVLHYQPQVEILTGKVIGAEALLRWQTDGALVPPSTFIPVAEACGCIDDVGEWVLREACREAKRWHDLGLGGEEGVKIGVNLSVKQITPTLPSLVHDVLLETGLKGDMLSLEITESFLAERNAMILLQSLRDAGVRLSIDDFGTGFSCLSQLRYLPLDTIKIDRSFVMDLEPDNGSAPVVETIINLANKLGMDTLAEGVETPAQAKALAEMGCSVCQGFLYSRPVPGSEFISFTSNSASTYMQNR